MVTNRKLRAVLEARDLATPVLKRVTRTIKFLGAAAGITGTIMLANRLVRGFTETIRVAADFEFQMSKVSAITKASAKDMEKLAKAARDLGRDTEFTARQVAEAQVNLARAGFTTEEVLDSLQGTLDLASAGQLDLADASRITADVLRGFGLVAGEAERVANVLAQTANTSNQTVFDLGEAFKFVAPAAKLAGVSLEDTAAALSVLANRGLRASIAGTALRRTFATLIGDTDAMAKGLGNVQAELFTVGDDGSREFVGLARALDIMREAGVSATQAFEIFGQRAGNAMAILLDVGGAAITEAQDKIKALGLTARQIAEERLDNLRGATIRLASAFESLRISSARDLTPVLQAILDKGVTPLLRGFSESISKSGVLGTLFVTTAKAVTQAARSFFLLTDAMTGGIGLFDLMAGLAFKLNFQLFQFSNLLDKISGRDSQTFQAQSPFLQQLTELDGALTEVANQLTETLKRRREFENETGIEFNIVQPLIEASATIDDFEQKLRKLDAEQKQAFREGGIPAELFADAGDSVEEFEKKLQKAEGGFSEEQIQAALRAAASTFDDVSRRFDTINTQAEQFDQTLQRAGIQPLRAVEDQVIALENALTDIQKFRDTEDPSREFKLKASLADDLAEQARVQLRKLDVEKGAEINAEFSLDPDEGLSAIQQLEERILLFGGSTPEVMRRAADQVARAFELLDEVELGEGEAGVRAFLTQLAEGFEEAEIDIAGFRDGADKALVAIGEEAQDVVEARIKRIRDGVEAAKADVEDGEISQTLFDKIVEKADAAIFELRQAGQEIDFVGDSLRANLRGLGVDRFVDPAQVKVVNEAIRELRQRLGETTDPAIRRGLIESGKALADQGRELRASGGPVEGLGGLNAELREAVSLYEQLGARSDLSSLAIDVDNLEAKWAELQRQRGQFSPEEFEILRTRLQEAAQALFEEGGFIPGFERIAELLQEIQTETVQFDEALKILTEEGVVGLRTHLLRSGKELETLGDNVQRTIRGIGIGAFQDLGNVIVDAADEGLDAFKDFFKRLLSDLAKAIIKATILQGILQGFSLIGGPAGLAASAAASRQFGTNIGGGRVGLQHGGAVPGITTGDRVPAMLEGREIVLTRALAPRFVDAARQGDLPPALGDALLSLPGVAMLQGGGTPPPITGPRSIHGRVRRFPTRARVPGNVGILSGSLYEDLLAALRTGEVRGGDGSAPADLFLDQLVVDSEGADQLERELRRRPGKGSKRFLEGGLVRGNTRARGSALGDDDFPLPPILTQTFRRFHATPASLRSGRKKVQLSGGNFIIPEETADAILEAIETRKAVLNQTTRAPERRQVAALPRFAAGGSVPDFGLDTTLGLFRPGEIVVPEDSAQTAALASETLGEGAGRQIEIEVKTNLPATARVLSDSVDNREITLVASRLRKEGRRI